MLIKTALLLARLSNKIHTTIVTAKDSAAVRERCATQNKIEQARQRHRLALEVAEQEREGHERKAAVLQEQANAEFEKCRKARNIIQAIEGDA